MDALPSLSNELEGLTKAMSIMSSHSVTIATKSEDTAEKLNSPSVKLVDQPAKVNDETILPSENIKTLLHRAEEQTARSLPTRVAERFEECAQVFEQPVIDAPPEQEILCPIAAAIDESERRIKAEEVRYSQLVANRSLYEYYMDPFEFRVLMRASATRLVNYDPVWDLAPEQCPLPTPWESYWARNRV